MKKAETKCWLLWFCMLAILLFVTSCSTIKNTKETQTTLQDSTWVKQTVVPKDTLIKVPPKHTRIAIDWSELTAKPVTKTKDKLTASLSRQGNTIIAECNQEQLELTIQLQNELLEYYRQRTESNSTKEVETKIKYRVPWYWKPFIALGLFSVFGLLMGLITPHIKSKSK